MNYGMFQRFPVSLQPVYQPQFTAIQPGYSEYVLTQSSKRRRTEFSTDDKRFLKNFEDRVTTRRKNCAQLTVAQALGKLGEVYKLLEKCKENLDDVDISKKLDESNQLVSEVCTAKNLKHLRKLFAQRQDKRQCRSVASTAVSTEKRNAKISALALEIDHWRATMLAQDKKKKQDEELKSTAGNTLQQVMQKQKQTKRLLETVKLLVELRDIRKEQSARRQGIFLDPEVDVRFNKNVTKVKGVIKEKLETFYAEEKTIKVLMEGNEADIWGVEKKLRQLEQIPDNVIDYSSVYLEIQFNPRKLVKIRREWDEHLVAPVTEGASRVPNLELKPPTVPSPLWAGFIRPDAT